MELSATMSALTDGLRNRVEALGLTGTIGLALMFFSVAFLLGGLEPLREEVKELQAQQERLAALPDRVAEKKGGESSKANVRDLNLPSATDALPQVMRLSDLAEKEGLKLRQGDYRLSRDREAGVVAYQMHYPIAGSYVALRRFINASLQEFPALALEEVLIRRNTIGATDVDARLRFTLYLKEK
jgi:hypothetical protein